jgi:hypothetical protein
LAISCPGRKTFRSRKPIAAVDDLKDLTIFTNDQSEAAVLETLGTIQRACAAKLIKN